MSEDVKLKLAILIALFMDAIEPLTFEETGKAYKRALDLKNFYLREPERLDFYLSEAKDLIEKDDWSFLDWD